jgi:hypothetical protein
MARVAPLYPTFARGEISPLMFGRSDVEAYASCLDKCRNCWVRPYGVVSRVAGTEYINTARGKARLLKFVFNAKDSYIIECGAGYFRFYRNGSYVVTNLGAIYEISNPFTEAQLSTIQYVQLDDVLKIVYEDDSGKTNEPLELIRRASNDWVLQKVSFKCTPFLDANTTATTLTASADSGTITVTASAALFEQSHVGSFWKMGGTVTIDDEERQGFFKITAVTDSTHATAVVQSKLSATTATNVWSEGAWSKKHGFPSKIALFEGRLYYARTPSNPRNVYGSHPYAYEDFTPAVNNEASGAINIELAASAAGDGSAIQWMNGANVLIAGTYGSEFVIRGGDSGITPSTVTANAKTNWGSEPIQPPTLGSLVYFVQRTGKKVRQFSYDYTLDTYKAIDVSLYSEHLLESPIVAVAYQKAPDSVVYCLRTDGKVAALTIETEQQVQAWSLLEFDGFVESVETVPSYNGEYDEVYFIVRRVINGQTVRYVERIQDPITPEIQSKCWYVRSGLHISAFEDTALLGLTISDTVGESTVTLTTTTAYFDDWMLNRRVRVIDDMMNLVAEYKIETVSANGLSATATVIKAADVENPYSVAAGHWGVSLKYISGLDHLVGKSVQILADGAVQTARTVANNGQIELETDAFYIIVGLGYRSYMKTMPLEAGSENGTSVGKRKRINEMALRVWRTSGCRVGGSLDNLQNVRYRDPATPMGMPQTLFTGIVSNIKYNQGWTWDANITIDQKEPLPMNILAIAPIINEVDK